MNVRVALARALTAVLLLSTLTGCGFTYHFKASNTVPGERHDEWASYFLFGIVGEHTIDVREFCGRAELHEVTTGTNFLTWLTTLVTLGIYSPRKVNITCSGGARSTSFEVDFAPGGAPRRVTRRIGGEEASGEVSALGGGRYGVMLRRADAVADATDATDATSATSATEGGAR
jgi:hypothetical protein